MGVLQDDVEGDVGSIPRCQRCSSERIVRNAWACWNPQTGLWELEKVFGQAYCQKCEDKTTLVWSRQTEMVQARVRELNDRFRCQGLGRGSVFVTSGVQALGSDFVLKAKHRCGPDEMYCLSCRAPRLPILGSVHIADLNEKTVRLFGVCCTCGGKICRAGSASRLQEYAASFGPLQKRTPSLQGSSIPLLDGDSKEQDENEQFQRRK